MSIATTKEQSARLIACGVDPKTADMSWHGNTLETFPQIAYDMWLLTPAWSLSVLLTSVLPMRITKDYQDFVLQLQSYPDEEPCYRWCLFYYETNDEISLLYVEAPDPIEACVLMVKKLIANNYQLNEVNFTKNKNEKK